MDFHTLKAKADEALRRADALDKRADAEQRVLTETEQREFDSSVAESRRLREQADRSVALVPQRAGVEYQTRSVARPGWSLKDGLAEGRSNGTFTVPWTALFPEQRAGELIMSAGPAAIVAGYVGGQAMARGTSAAQVLGARPIFVEQGRALLPRPEGTKAGWVAELEGPPAATVTVPGIEAPILAVRSLTVVSAEMLAAGASPDLLNLLMDDMRGAIAEASDKAVFGGLGPKQPVGLKTASGVTNGSATFTWDMAGVLALAAAVWAKSGQVTGFALNAAAAAKLGATASVGASSPSGVLRFGDDGRPTILGVPAIISENVADPAAAANGVIACGNWAQLSLVYWGAGLQVKVDDLSQGEKGIVRLIGQSIQSHAFREPGHFAYATKAIA